MSFSKKIEITSGPIKDFNLSLSVNFSHNAEMNEKIQEYLQVLNFSLDELNRKFQEFSNNYIDENKKSIWMIKPVQKKIEAIKSMRELSGIGLKEAKDIIESRCPYDIGQHMNLNEFNYKEALNKLNDSGEGSFVWISQKYLILT